MDFAALFLCFVFQFNCPQDNRTGAIEGSVTISGSAEPIIGAFLKVEQNITRSVSSGSYTFDSLTPGEHLLTARAKGFEPLTIPVDVIARQTAQFDLQLTRINTAPVATSSTLITNEDVSTVIDFRVRDAEDDDLRIFIERTPRHGSLAGTYPAIVYTPDENYFGPDEIRFRASDGKLDSNSSIVSITVTAVNDAPTITGNIQTIVSANHHYSFTPETTDIDDDLLTFSITNMPSWATFNPSSGELSGTPSNLDAALYTDIAIEVTDGGDTSALGPFSLLVQPNAWNFRRDMPEAISHQAAAIHNGIIYLFGGYPRSNAVYSYDPAANAFTRRADMPINAFGVHAHSIGDRIYVIASDQINGPFHPIYEYDPNTDGWMQKSERPTTNGGFSSAVVEGKIYIIGGYDDVAYATTNTVDIYDSATNSWTTGQSAPSWLTSEATTCAIDGKIYYMGGTDDALLGTYKSVKVYDPAQDSWTTANDAPSLIYGSACTVMDGKLFVIGGHDTYYENTYSFMYSLDPATGSWTTEPPISQPRADFAAASASGKVYVFGGYHNVDGRLFSTEEFDPTSFAP